MGVQDRLYTAQDLWNMPDDGKIYELHNGVLFEVAGSGETQSTLAAWIIYLLTNHNLQNNIGGRITGADGTFVLGPHNTRIPDVAYIPAQNIQKRVEQGFHVGPPALAVEVVSPSNTPIEMQQRAGEYLNAGARLVWIVNPETRGVDVYREGGERIQVSSNGELEGYDVLPGLKVSLKVLFKPLDDA